MMCGFCIIVRIGKSIRTILQNLYRNITGMSKPFYSGCLWINKEKSSPTGW